MQISPARRAAFDILERVEQEGSYASVLTAKLDDELRADDRALCHELVFGVLRQRLWLDRVIETFAGRRIETLDLPVTLALRLGLYQIRFLSRIPAAAAVNESVNLVRAARLKSAAGLVNAVLRRATRETDYDPLAQVTEDRERLSIETSHPRWLIDRWISSFGFNEAQELARADNRASAVAFRFTAKAAQLHRNEGILVELEAAGAEIHPSPIVSDSWRIKGAAKLVRQLSQDGLIYVQDEASQLVAHLLAPQANETVLDVCAAPGSKSTLMSLRAPSATIVCGDVYEHRALTIVKLARRQEASNLNVALYDATRDLPFPSRTFDRVLVDAPCSGTGTLRRNPEIRWRITPADIADLSALQGQILGNAAKLVRVGGSLVYSTCSLELEENESVAHDFINQHADFQTFGFDSNSDLMTDQGFTRIWPHRQDTDGFFVAGFRRGK